MTYRSAGGVFPAAPSGLGRTFSARSQCDGKVRYLSRKWARQAVRQARGRGMAGGRLCVYQCPHCGFFHAGHKVTRGGR